MITLKFSGNGTDAGTNAATEQTFEQADEILVGRDRSWAGFVIPATERLVSRRHARLYRDAGGHWRIERQGDRFIAVNGTPVEQTATLKSGDTLTLGRSDGPALTVTFDAPALPGGEDDRTATQEIVTTWRDHLPRMQTLGRRVTALAAAVAVLALALAGSVYYFSGRTDGFSEETIARLRNAAYLVVLRDENGGESAIGTAWPVAPDKLATNAHVAELFDRIDHGSERFIVRSPGASPRSLDVRAVRIHSGYAGFADYVSRRSTGAEGFRSGYVETSRPSAFDVALLLVETDEPLSPVLELADTETVHAAGAGTRLAYAGYPVRCVDGGGAKPIAPDPNVQQGAISTVTDYFMFPAGDPSQALLVQHSAPATGGASGAPLIGTDGKVIAVLSGGTVIRTGSQEGADDPCSRAPSAVMINYAQRADLVAELLREADAPNTRQRRAYWEEQVSRFADHYAFLKRQVVANAEKKSRKDFAIVMEGARSEPVEAAGNKVTFDVEEGREYAILVYNRDKANLFVSMSIDGKPVAQDGNAYMPSMTLTAPASGTAELTIYASGGDKLDYELLVAAAER